MESAFAIWLMRLHCVSLSLKRRGGLAGRPRNQRGSRAPPRTCAPPPRFPPDPCSRAVLPALGKRQINLSWNPRLFHSSLGSQRVGGCPVKKSGAFPRLPRPFLEPGSDFRAWLFCEGQLLAVARSIPPHGVVHAAFLPLRFSSPPALLLRFPDIFRLPQGLETC